MRPPALPSADEYRREYTIRRAFGSRRRTPEEEARHLAAEAIVAASCFLGIAAGIALVLIGAFGLGWAK